MNANDFLIHTALWVDIDMQFFASEFTPNHLDDTNFDDTIAF